MKNTAIYTRETTAKQSNSSNLQLDKCRLKAEAIGYPVTKEIIDLGKSSNNRKELQELIAVLEKNHIKAIIVYKVDRLTRNISDLNYLIGLLVKKGIELISVKDSINTTKSSDQLVLSLLEICKNN